MDLCTGQGKGGPAARGRGRRVKCPTTIRGARFWYRLEGTGF